MSQRWFDLCRRSVKQYQYMDDTDQKPITTQDLYAPSDTQNPDQEPPAHEPLSYEETPILKPVTQEPVFPGETPRMQEQTPPKRLNVLGLFLLFALLFVLGYVGSGYIRRFLAKSTPGTKTKVAVSPTATPASLLSDQFPVGTPSASSWTQYPVVNGKTKQQIDTLFLSLPSDVLPPICDDKACSSQGTYLPGGSRLTIAPRGTGQVLPAFIDQTITDAKGVAMTTKDTTILGKPAKDYTGNFSGSSVSGYRFTKIHGVMIEITPGVVSLEINHFVPAGITADFAADDELFETILQTLSSGGEEKGIAPGASVSPSQQ